MNKEWSEKIKEIHNLISKKNTYAEGIIQLIEFRNELFGQITHIVKFYPEEAFSKMPFMNAKGYHSKSLAYSIWHIFRIEDIVAHTLLKCDEQIFFKYDYKSKIGADIITTGNELQKDAIASLSSKININELYEYANLVRSTTNEIINDLDYQELHRKFDDNDKERLLATKCVSEDENAIWLIDYWCGKNVLGLLKMPFSRHWLVHIEAMQRIKKKLCMLARKGVDPIAYCGFSCNHCFLGQWCGSCRTEYNTCAFSTCFDDKICPNVACCKEKNIDGCYECDELYNCTKGFYTPENSGSKDAKTQALFIKKYGRKNYLKIHDVLCSKYDFETISEMFGKDVDEGLKILEEINEQINK